MCSVLCCTVPCNFFVPLTCCAGLKIALQEFIIGSSLILVVLTSPLLPRVYHCFLKLSTTVSWAYAVFSCSQCGSPVPHYDVFVPCYLCWPIFLQKPGCKRESKKQLRFETPFGISQSKLSTCCRSFHASTLGWRHAWCSDDRWQLTN